MPVYAIGLRSDIVVMKVVKILIPSIFRVLYIFHCHIFKTVTCFMIGTRATCDETFISSHLKLQKVLLIYYNVDRMLKTYHFRTNPYFTLRAY